MNKNRKENILTLTKNLKLMMDHSKRKILAFTTDCKQYSSIDLINEISENLVIYNAKVLVLSYKNIITKINKVNYYVIDIIKDNKETINKLVEKYDYVMVDCPNMFIDKSYLHMIDYVKDIVIVAKQWRSKIENISNIKMIADANKLQILGIVYEQ